MSSQQMPGICFDSLLSFEIDNEAECRKQFKRQLTLVFGGDLDDDEWDS